MRHRHTTHIFQCVQVQASAVFQHADTDGDGHISHVEFLRMLRVEVRDNHDENNDSEQDKTEDELEIKDKRFDVLEEETERTFDGISSINILSLRSNVNASTSTN